MISWLSVGYSDFKARQDSWEVKHFRTAYPEFARKTLKLASMSAAPDAVRVNCFASCAP